MPEPTETLDPEAIAREIASSQYEAPPERIRDYSTSRAGMLADRILAERHAEDLQSWQARQDQFMQQQRMKLDALGAMRGFARDAAAARAQETQMEMDARSAAEATRIMEELPKLDPSDPSFMRNLLELQSQNPVGAQTAGVRSYVGTLHSMYKDEQQRQMELAGPGQWELELRELGATPEQLDTIRQPNGRLDAAEAASMKYRLRQQERQEAGDGRLPMSVLNRYDDTVGSIASTQAEIKALEESKAGMRESQAQEVELEIAKKKAALRGYEAVATGMAKRYPELGVSNNADEGGGGDGEDTRARPAPDTTEIDWEGELPAGTRDFLNDSDAWNEFRQSLRSGKDPGVNRIRLPNGEVYVLPTK